MDIGSNPVSKESTWQEIVFKQLHGKDHNHMRVGSKIRVMSGDNGESCESHTFSACLVD